MSSSSSGITIITIIIIIIIGMSSLHGLSQWLAESDDRHRRVGTTASTLHVLFMILPHYMTVESYNHCPVMG